MMKIQEEVWKHIDNWLKSGKGPLRPREGTLDIMEANSEIYGRDAPFYIAPTHDAVRDEYHRQAKLFKANADVEPNPQLLMNGFERLQKAYPVNRLYECEVSYEQLTAEERAHERDAAYEPLERNGSQYVVMRAEPVLVKIDDLTDEELNEKEREYREMAVGCIAHANEIAVYRRSRRAVA